MFINSCLFLINYWIDFGETVSFTAAELRFNAFVAPGHLQHTVLLNMTAHKTILFLRFDQTGYNNGNSNLKMILV